MKQRMEGLDVARAFAILGMMFVNYALVFEVKPTSSLGIFFMGLEGRAAAVFMIVAGIGIGLLSKKGTNRQLYIQIVKRSLFLWVLGLTLFSIFDWTADILHYYGMFMVVALPFLRADKKTIGVGIGVTLLISMYLQLTQNYVAGWDFVHFKYVDFWTADGFLRNLMFNGFHPMFPWLAFMLMGLLISKLPIHTAIFQKKMMIFGMAIAAGAEMTSHLIITFFLKETWAQAFIQTKPMPPNLFYVIAATGWAIFFISFCIWATEQCRVKRWVLESFIYTGQLSLTHYVGHSALVLTIIDELGWLRPQSANFVLLLTLGVYASMMLLSLLWRRKFERGPIELVMRKISDGVKSIA